MEVMRKIFISDGDPDEGISISQWEGEEDTYHLKFPQGTKVHLDTNKKLSHLEFPNGSRIYLHLDGFKEVEVNV